MRKILLLVLLIDMVAAQDVPYIMDHPIYHFFARQEALGNINAEYWSTRPYTYMQINEMLAEISGHFSDLTVSDRKILERFQHEFNREFKEGITFPWSKSSLRGLRHPSQQETPPFFMTYHQGNTLGWINWSETFRLQNNGKATRGYYTDHLGIFGSQGQISFTSQFTYHRITKSDQFTELPASFKEGYILDRDYIDWITWDYPTSSLVYTHPNFTLGIHRQPVYWGYSAENSPILSDNVNPLPHVEWTTKISHLRYRFLHARLTPNETLNPDTLNVRRNLTAQRVEFDIGPNFEFSFNEMIVYAHRDFELAYLNPVNFLFSEEHVQGDLDNLLMAFDFKWRLRPGVVTYGTWLFDELDWYKLFSGWWGNKFVFQLGLHYYPKVYLPSINLEYTAARPWTYSHLYAVNSYTSAGRLIGLPSGPNTETMTLNMNWQATSKFGTIITYAYELSGDGSGSDVFSTYSDRDLVYLENAPFLTGKVHSSHAYRIQCIYDLNRMISGFIDFQQHSAYFLSTGVAFNW
ncbi:MAG: hypothetical protein K9N35_07340 [Candidatus Marinimicrobia bacterium]|nr:hypothetical protein [Candidatus Neomarinimicrobiota bacterium]